MAKKAVTISRIFALGVFSFCIGMVAMIAPSQVKAESAEADVSAKINSAIAISLTNCDGSNNSQIPIQLVPSPVGTFKSNCQTVNVRTNAPGYTLTARASSSTLDYQNPTTISPKPAIDSTDNTIDAPGLLENNTWGFAVKDRLDFDETYYDDDPSGNFSLLSTIDEVIYETDQFPLPETDHKFYYGAKITTDSVAGTYMSTVTYTAVGAEVPEPPMNLREIVAKNSITTMQTLTPALCAAAVYDTTNGGINSNNTVVLSDTRNNQDYRVRKMPDNKCWMIDNLKLATPGASLKLTSNDTNLAQGTTFTIPADAITAATERATNGVCVDGVITGTGDYLTCDGTSTQSAVNNAFIAYADPSNTANCLNNTTINDDTVAYSTDSETGCGYLYNWYTATAGTGTYDLTSGSDATASICPVGWRLPSAGTGTATTANEFAVLNGAMVGSDSDATTPPNWRPGGLFSGTYAGRWVTSFGNQGNHGYYWSSSASSSTTYARTLTFYYNYVYPGNTTSGKYYGFSVRCTL